jgi:PAS domain S-box-containing protein
MELFQRETEEFFRAIRSFHQSSSKLKDIYKGFRKEVIGLKRELQEKNIELERNLAEKERIQDHLSCILESLTASVIVVDLDGKLTTMNREAEALLNTSLLEAKGKKISSLFLPHIEDPKVLESIEILRGMEKKEMEIRWLTKDNECLHLHMTAIMMRDRAGNEAGKIIMFHDLTQIKRMEGQLNRKNRIAALGDLAARVAHEVRNPLGSIELIASIMKKELEQDEEKARLIEHIIVSVRKIDHCISNLLTFTRAPRPSFQEIDLNGLLEETLDFVCTPLRYAGIDVCKNFTLKRPIIIGDRELLEQSFINIIINAMQSMDNGGLIEIFTRIHNGIVPIIGEKPSGPFSGDWSSIDWVDIGFRDEGCGIPRENIQRIFDPFFTTKKTGAGLGLAIVHNIINAHNGMINVESTEGKGTIITISLPLYMSGQDETR